MCNSYFDISLRFVFGFICYFCFEIQAEPINLNKKADGPIMLVTSEQMATFNQDPKKSAKKAQKAAQQLCMKIGKKLSMFQTLMFEKELLNQMYRSETYTAYVADDKLDRLVFMSADFPLVAYPKTSLAQKLELFSFGFAGLSFVAGGISTYIVWIGLDGHGDPQKALIFGATTAALTSLGIITGGISWLYQKFIPHEKKASEPENGETTKTSLALPILAQQIICE